MFLLCNSHNKQRMMYIYFEPLIDGHEECMSAFIAEYILFLQLVDFLPEGSVMYISLAYLPIIKYLKDYLNLCC